MWKCFIDALIGFGYIHICIQLINIEEDMSMKENMVGYVGGFGRRKKRREKA